MIYQDRMVPDRTGTERNRNEPVPIYGISGPNHDTVPFRIPVQCIPSRPEYYRTGTVSVQPVPVPCLRLDPK
ncbi:hypothetical protein H5410_043051 [Solanum commersonii]|uniref:Uncharacterized protein n=1 Tax=Solanum commersonii TaxID=4109 RepID=A0A9J5XWH1_SOLCO|nr:hypothetical protein H5410_043051 [Solanum commersonii]